MFGPCDSAPVPVEKAISLRYVREGNQRFLVIVFSDRWIKVEMNRRQASGLVEDVLPDVLVK